MSEKLNAQQKEWLLGAMAEAGGEAPPEHSADDFIGKKITWDLFEKLFRSPIAGYINREIEPRSPYPKIPFDPSETVQQALQRFLDAKKSASSGEASE